MNDIEQKLYDALLDITSDSEIEIFKKNLHPQYPIPPYIVDFLIDFGGANIVIEVDGHESHKTKEQRQKDYERERYLIEKGYLIIRFTGSEVFIDPVSCARSIKACFAGHMKEREKAIKNHEEFKKAFKKQKESIKE